jgi:uncharacterized protein (TIGR02466 family)
MIENVTPWAPIIHKVHFKGELEPAIKKIRANAILIDPNRGVMKGGGKTSAGDIDMPHLWPEFDEFMTWLKPHVEDLWSNVYKLNPAELNVYKSWTNITSNNAYVEEHDHGGSHFAVSFYIKKPKDSGNIEFRNFNRELWSAYPKQTVTCNRFFTEVEAEERDCLIFPGWLGHKVQPNTTNQERIVFSMNIHGTTGNSPVLI